MGIDLVNTASGSLDLISKQLQRMRDLTIQASNGVYGTESISAMQDEIDARFAEINCIIDSTEYNGLKLLGESNPPMEETGSFINDVEQLTEEEAIAKGYTIIKTADDLQAMNNNLNGKYILMNDIDLKGYNWQPVGGTNPSTAFKGRLNGNGFVIRNLELTSSTKDYRGLFSYANGTSISNLGLEDVKISGKTYVGGIVGSMLNTTIDNCYVTGEINALQSVGGIVGMQQYSTVIKNCYTNISVVANNNIAGGITGTAHNNDPKIINCYSTGSVKSKSYAGGIVGTTNANSSAVYISKSYSKCKIEANTYVGGIVGYYSTSSCKAIDTYWDTDIIEKGVGVSASADAVFPTGVKSNDIDELIRQGVLAKAIEPVDKNIYLQIGINNSTNSQYSLNTTFNLQGSTFDISNSLSIQTTLKNIDEAFNKIADKQLVLGSASFRLESASEEVSTQYENLLSARSTLRDADMAEVSASYIQQQILQQASATLIASSRNVRQENVLGLLQGLRR